MSIMFAPLRLIPAAVQAVVLSTVLNMFFSRDPKLAAALHALDGRVFHLHVNDMGQSFYLGFAGRRVWVHTGHAGASDARIEATGAGFTRLCFARETLEALRAEGVLALSGDPAAIEGFVALLQQADIDWERELRAAFGEYFGTRVAAAARRILQTDARKRGG